LSILSGGDKATLWKATRKRRANGDLHKRPLKKKKKIMRGATVLNQVPLGEVIDTGRSFKKKKRGGA